MTWDLRQEKKTNWRGAVDGLPYVFGGLDVLFGGGGRKNKPEPFLV